MKAEERLAKNLDQRVKDLVIQEWIDAEIKAKRMPRDKRVNDVILDEYAEDNLPKQILKHSDEYEEQFMPQ